jgi:hypothetical protein
MKYPLFCAIFTIDLSERAVPILLSSFFIILIYARASSTAAFPLITGRQHSNRDPATHKALILTLIGA